ncbi:MAG: uroporphyrinogen decarboxylase [Bacteroidota bacterium]|nr:uroporphyrinogen decarboxylase [Bacteroidota bacterium]MEC7247442.1 uroporphyrinogen decarboxylase [Bacteroidota bacterium]MEC7549304.1 uroporphyrinogen decarboxylase [Bacteroidota bacterium]MEC7829336.1 uroporphyrinogen decarboxylase [Bacteroidota bacterium]MEC8098363.1 uroporphyrinogen decarboxylase [Bacteroidota bacterium]
MIKNRLLLDALNGDNVSRPPVWMMRQAGRYLPDFMKLKEKYDFFTRCKTPELAAKITLMPIEQIGTDAAILFSDILVVPQAMGVDVEMRKELGPFIPKPIREAKQIEKIVIPDVDDNLNYVFEAIRLSKQMIDNRVPLIGFAGSPWTVLCYMVQGQGSKNFDIAKSFCFSQPEAAHMLLEKITTTTIKYLKSKVKAGVNVIQLFDSWGGLLSEDDYQKFSWHYNQKIIDSLKSKTKIISFSKGCWFALPLMAKSGVDALGIDWTCSARNARYLTGGKVTLQGNLDPSRLMSTPKEIEKLTKKMIAEFGVQKYIVNLGHGILPNVPVDNAKAFVNTVKNYSV